jgi:hypothetical protein
MVSITLVSLLLGWNHFALAQCPSNIADLVNGGTFSGNCTVAVGGNITITGNVTWTSGTLSINGNDGNLNIQGSITIQNGATVRVDDNNDGDLDILSGGSLIVQQGGTFFTRESIQVQSGGSMEVSGIVYSEVDNIDIDAGAVVTVNPTGTLTTGTDDDILVQGTLHVYGTITAADDIIIQGGTLNAYDGSDVNSGDDINVNGGTLTLLDGANVDGGDDLNVTNGGTLDIQSGAVFNLAEEFVIDDSNAAIAGTLVTAGNDDVFVNGNSTITFEDGAIFTFNDMEFGTGDGGSQVIINGGAVTINGEVDYNNGQDGDAIVVNGGTLDMGNDLELGTTNGTLTINSGGVVSSPSVDNLTYTDVNDLPANIIIKGTGIFLLDGVPLPVVLLYFKATCQDGGYAYLEWSTSSEINNEGFFIEKSVNGVDFSTIGFVEGNGNSNDIHTYAFIDRAFYQDAYYRLKQVDFDGAFEYFKVVFVSNQSVKNRLAIHPNPVSNELHLSGLTDESISVTLYDHTGKALLIVEKASPNEIESTISKELPILREGIYFLTLRDTHGSQTLKFLKK